MPTPSQITESLSLIANEFTAIALGWHVVFAAFGVAVAAGWWPYRRTVATFIALPCWSVAMLAWYSGNPFTGTIFSALALALMTIAAALPHRHLTSGSAVDRFAGAALIAFGLVYPHFVNTYSWFEYAYTSPFGLIPCPTLSVIAGVTLLANGFENRAWTIWLAIVTALYGVMGFVLLRVEIDVVLLMGAVALAVHAMQLNAERIPAAVGDFSHKS